MILKRFSVFQILLCISLCAGSFERVYAQASLQRKVNISNTNGNLLSLQTAVNVQPYTLTFPPTVNPSSTTASLLYGTGSGNLGWTDVTGATSGWILTLTSSGGNLVPSWSDPLLLNYWSLNGNPGTTAWNGTTGNYIGTSNTQPLVIATTNTATPQPIEFFTGNTEKMVLNGAGDLGVGTTNPSQLLQVNNGNILLSNSAAAGQLQFQGTGSGITTFQAGAQGAANINYTLPTSAPTVDGQLLSSTITGTLSWANVGTVTSVGLALPPNVFSVSNSPVTTSGTLTGSLLGQPANTVFAGPMSGSAVPPTFRTLVPADIPALNYVISVGLSLPNSLFSVSGSPVTSTGTLTGSLVSQAPNLVFASPNGSGGVPSFRSIVPGDIPLTTDHIFVGNNGVAQDVPMSGDATIVAGGALTLATVGPGVTTVGDGTHVATVTLDTKGRVTALTSTLITGAAPTGAASGDLAGNYPAPTIASTAGAGNDIISAINLGTPSSLNANPLKHDATLLISSNQLGINLGNPNTWTAVQTFPNSSLTYAELQNETENTLLGRNPATNGPPQEITLGSNLAISSGGVLSVIGVVGTLTLDHIFVGNASNLATDVPMSGDVSIVSSGATTVNKVNGVAYPSGPSVNTVPVVTGPNTVTYEAIPNTALGNSTIAIGSTGSTISVTGSPISLGGAPGNLELNLAHANTWTAVQTFPNASITNNELANSTIAISSTGSTLTVTGSPISLGGAAGNLDLNLAHANTWTAAQTFSGAGTLIYKDGNQAPNAVLTSDVNGVASWAPLSGLGVTSVTGTAPVVASPTSGAVVVSLTQGNLTTAGTITLTGTGKTVGADINADLNLGHANTWTSVQTFPNSSITNVELANSTIGLNSSGSTLTITGSPISLGGAGNLDLNLGHANTWTGIQTFPNSSITNSELANSTIAISSTGSTLTVTGSPISLGGAAGNLDLNLAHANTWTGAQTLSGAGTLIYKDGNQALNKVLTSDANGVAMWTSLSGLGVTSVTGTAPIVASPTSGAVVVSLNQGNLTSSSSSLTVTGTGTTVGANINADLNLGHANTWTAVQTFPNSSITNVELANSTIGINSSGSTLTVTGSPIALGGSGNLDLNLAHANTWTATQTFPNSSLTYAEIQNETVNTLLGRNPATPGPPQEITLGANLTLSNSGVLSVIGVTTALTTNHIFVGNASNIATDVPMSGDVSIVASGATTVNKVNGVAYPSGPVVNTVPVVTGANTVTYEAIPNNVLANSTIGITSSGSTLAVTGSPISLGGSGNLDLNLAHANTWTATQTFSGAGTLVYNDGNQGLNKILVSDGSGVASWTSLAGIGVTTATGTAPITVNGDNSTHSGAITIALNQGSLTSGGTITIGGTGKTVASNITADLNLANPNTWTAVQTFPSASLTYSEIQNETANTLLGRNALTSGSPQEITIGSNLSISNGGVLSVTGVVTSVGLQMPAALYSSVTNSPITSSGILIPQLASQAANTIFAGPTSGGNATPSFRALVSADLPSGSGFYIDNQTTVQPSSNFNISGTGVATAFTGLDGSSGSALTVRGGNGTSTTGGALNLSGGTSNSGVGGAVNLSGGTTGAASSSNGGDVTVNGGDPAGANASGGQLFLRAGNSSGNKSGNPAYLTGGASGSTGGSGGTVQIQGGAGGSTSGAGGVANIFGGNATNGAGGAIAITAGSAAGATGGVGGNVGISAGAAATTGNGGSISLAAGTSAGLTGNAGTVSIVGGNSGAGTVAGGGVSINGGNGSTTGAGGAVQLTGGTAGSLGVGGAVNIVGGSSALLTGTGGVITFQTTPSTAVNVTERMRIANNGYVGINQNNPTQLLEVKSGNLLLSNAGSAGQIQFQGTSSGITTFQAGAQGITNINYTLPVTAPSASSILYSSALGALSWTNTGTAGQVLTISGGVPSWQNASASANSWLNAGNSGLTDNVSNFFGTLDNKPIRFTTGTYLITPNTRMVLDISGNILLGGNSGSTTFSTGSGHLALGDNLTTTHLNGIAAKPLDIIDANGAMRLWAFATPTSGTDPTIELVGGTNDNQGNAANTWWDMYTTGTPYSTNTGTHSSGEHFAIRRRTGTVDSEMVSVFANGNVGIGEDGSNTGGVANAGTRLTVANNDAVTAATTNIITLQHNSTGTPTTNFGTGLDFQGESSTTANRDMGAIKTIWTTATDATRTSAMTFSTDTSTSSSPTEKMRIAGNGYVGLNTTSPGVRMHINGGYATTSQTINLNAGENDNVPVGDCAYLRVNVTAGSAFTITGLAAGVDGQRLRLVDVNGNDMTIANGSALSTYGNRIETDVGSDITVKGTVPILDMTYDSTLHEWMLGTLNANQVIGGIGSIIYATKANDLSYTNQNVLQSDNDLSFSVSANQTWELNGELDAEIVGNQAPDIKMGFTFPNNSTMKIFYTGIAAAGGNAITGEDKITESTATTSTSSTCSIISNVKPSYITIRGIVTTTASGTLQFQWSQNNATNNTSTVLKAGSYMKIIRVK
jgi:hypothetical protein